ncbi:hypothetical protein [Paraburkholderia saeva]|uniref:Uncharacterized protein n=1 Tax=Paraburkholderia saeva TaxID=2777537 RepID=A0A9N8X135_9BURK|nr:hypothetical protein [Paraburkholderia saeva]CAG4887071.1 hypothetical protein R52603_00323 [Paraburkholderia saeva]CAG4894583.1 hypothetical protein LMG31841_01943 [Paraburkholderia saeva]CAG4898712.1 hypothetical protein R70241_02514 [Paraburkholderia saeva]
MNEQRYIDLPVYERAAFELVCARRGFAPTHFEITGTLQMTDGTSDRLVTVRRGRWAQSYRADAATFWVRDFETDLTCNFFK